MDFKGMIQLSCDQRCQLEYHKLCWRAMKTWSGGDREALGTPCPTPDCAGLVCSVIVIKEDGEELPPFVNDGAAGRFNAKRSKSVEDSKKRRPTGGAGGGHGARRVPKREDSPEPETGTKSEVSHFPILPVSRFSSSTIPANSKKGWFSCNFTFSWKN